MEKYSGKELTAAFTEWLPVIQGAGLADPEAWGEKKLKNHYAWLNRRRSRESWENCCACYEAMVLWPYLNKVDDPDKIGEFYPEKGKQKLAILKKIDRWYGDREKRGAGAYRLAEKCGLKPVHAQVVRPNRALISRKVQHTPAVYTPETLAKRQARQALKAKRLAQAEENKLAEKVKHTLTKDRKKAQETFYGSDPYAAKAMELYQVTPDLLTRGQKGAVTRALKKDGVEQPKVERKTEKKPLKRAANEKNQKKAAEAKARYAKTREEQLAKMAEKN
jgi:hypothetical protein